MFFVISTAHSETGSQANTLEMFNAPTITEDSKSYTTYERRSPEDFPDEYRPYDVSCRSCDHIDRYVRA